MICRPSAKAPVRLGTRPAPRPSLWPLRLWQEERLAADELTAVYRDIERPLADVLYAMEREGFLIDADVLEALGRDFRARAAELEGQIYDLAGGDVQHTIAQAALRSAL